MKVQPHGDMPAPDMTARVRCSRVPAEVRPRQFQKRGASGRRGARMARFSDAYVWWRLIEIEIAAARGPTSQTKKVERPGEPPSAITPAGTSGPQLHCAAAIASASVG